MRIVTQVFKIRFPRMWFFFLSIAKGKVILNERDTGKEKEVTGPPLDSFWL